MSQDKKTADCKAFTAKSATMRAFTLSFVCIFTYVISYFVRNLLNVLTPTLTASGSFTEEYLALVASTYMIVYAAGQLVCGTIGDYIRAKYMILIGLSLSAAGLYTFALVHHNIIGIVAFSFVGFGLSMLRGPLVKLISENTSPKAARIACVFLSFSSFAGPLLAGLVAMFLDPRGVFLLAATFTLAMGVVCFFLFTLFERRGIIQYKERVRGTKNKIDLLSLFRLRNFGVYLVISMVVEIAAASVNFWLTSLFTEYYLFSADTANLLFSAISLIRSFCPFLALLVFQLFRERDMTIVRTFYGLAAGLLLAVFFLPPSLAYLCVGLIALSLVCSSICSACLWSIYIPSLAASGKVSGANGVIDCCGYLGAAVANVAILPVMSHFGWSGVSITWAIIMAVGSLITLFGKNAPDVRN